LLFSTDFLFRIGLVVVVFSAPASSSNRNKQVPGFGSPNNNIQLQGGNGPEGIRGPPNNNIQLQGGNGPEGIRGPPNGFNGHTGMPVNMIRDHTGMPANMARDHTGIPANMAHGRPGDVIAEPVFPQGHKLENGKHEVKSEEAEHISLDCIKKN
jgi:hypothetical protein